MDVRPSPHIVLGASLEALNRVLASLDEVIDLARRQENSEYVHERIERLIADLEILATALDSVADEADAPGEPNSPPS